MHLVTVPRKAVGTFVRFALVLLGLLLGSPVARAQPPLDPPVGFALEATTGDVSIGPGAVVDSSTTCDDELSTGNRGSIRAAGTITVDPTATVLGQLLPKSPSGTLPVPPPGDLVPGADLVALPGETLILPAGEYLVDDLSLGSESALRADGPVRLFVTGRLELGAKSSAEPTSGDPRDLLMLVQSGASAAALGDDARLTGLLHAPDRSLSLGARSTTLGAVVGGKITVRSTARVRFDEALADGCGPLDQTPPELSIVSPEPEVFVLRARPEVVALVDDPTGPNGEEASGIDPSSLALTLDGAPLAADCSAETAATRCVPTVDLPDGRHVLGVVVRDLAGNGASAGVGVEIDTAGVEIAITEPAPGLLTAADTLEVRGVVGPGVIDVTVNHVPATLTGDTFVAIAPLRAGTNLVSAVATKASGLSGSAALEVTRDAARPLVRITTPRAGLVAVSPRVAVAGLVSDSVSGGVEPTVTVNGVEAQVVDGTFVVPEVELLPGPNVLEAVAVDAAGNAATTSIEVVFRRPVGARLEVGGGDGQTATVGATLPAPLEVRVVDDLDQPIAGRVVRFEVTRNSGVLRALDDATPRRVLNVPSDGDGRARATFSLGDTAGAGNNRVRVTATGAAGELELCASATSGAPAQILAVDGFNQTGQVEQPLPRPLEVRVIDDEGNPVAGAPVRYEVVGGDGGLQAADATAPSLPVRTLPTDADGYARATFLLGATPTVAGHVVEARLDDPASAHLEPAVFANSALSPGAPEDTVFSGIVLDNALTPIPATVVTVTPLGGGSPIEAVTDDAGRFRAEGVEPGPLMVFFDPRESPRPETFPPILFETVAIAGRDNTVGRPVMLPPIDVDSTKIVGGDDDVTLTMRGVDGFSITVYAGSTTFPDGSRIGPMSVSQIQLDKVPMAPPTGSIFMPPAWTLQPAGVHFDPPARVVIPNDGLEPGRVIEIFQLDPAIEDFVVVGQGVVEEDGALIVGDEGFGIERSGWGGCGLPPLPGTDFESGQETEDPQCPVSPDDPLPIGDLPPLASEACDRLQSRAVLCNLIFSQICRADCVNACAASGGDLSGCNARCQEELERCTQSEDGCEDAIDDLAG